LSTRLPIVDEPGSQSDVSLMQVGDLAKETGKTVRAIHLYEQLALLKPAKRSSGGYRLYGPDAVERIRWIAKLQALGLSLPDLQEVVRDAGPTQVATVATRKLRELYQVKLHDIQEELHKLKALEQELAQSLEYLETCGDVCEPERLVSSCTSCDLHTCETAEDEQTTRRKSRGVPELVRGLRVHAM
jgi:MerR family transcriptional regulator, copper efflux regulator